MSWIGPNQYRVYAMPRWQQQTKYGRLPCWESVSGSGGQLAIAWQSGSLIPEVRFAVYCKWPASTYWESRKHTPRLRWRDPQEILSEEPELGQDCDTPDEYKNRQAHSPALLLPGGKYAWGMQLQLR